MNLADSSAMASSRRIRPWWRIGVASVTLLAASAAIGQAPVDTGTPPHPPPAATEPQPPASAGTEASAGGPAIRVSTRLVQVSVVVKDKKGEPVSDLTKDDFTLLDGNKPQEITDFSVQATHLTAATAPRPPANTFTNRFEDQAGVPTSATVVLFDALNTHFSDLAYARQEVLKFIAQMQPGDRVAIFGLSQELYMIQDFTSDPQALIEAVKKATGAENQHLNPSVAPSVDMGVDPIQDELAEFLNAMNQISSDLSDRDRAVSTSDALTAIAHYIGRLPGRKNLVWVSSGFPLEINADALSAPHTPGATVNTDEATFDDQLETAAEALIDANVAVYPVDAGGLGSSSAMSATQNATPTSMGRRNQRPVSAPVPSRGPYNTMDAIAQRTGGRAYYNTNDITGSVRDAVDDSRVTYVLGYYPDIDKWNGKFREIKVKVNRPGVDVRYRSGYFAVADAGTTPVQRQVLVQDALDSPLDATGIGMTVRATLGGAPGAQTIHVEIHADTQTIGLAPEGDHWNAALDWFIAQWDDKQKLMQALGQTSQIRLDQADRETWVKYGTDKEFDIPLLPGASRIRFGACDEQSGATGSVTIAIKSLAAAR